MKTRLLLPALLIAGMGISSCKKSESSSKTNDCSLPNGYLRCNDGTDDFCADASLFADNAIVLTINGMTSQGATLTIELDSINAGTYPVNENTNHFLYTDKLGMGYESTDDNPGTVTITSNNRSTNKITGSFIVPVREHLLGTSKTLHSGTFSLNYTE